MRRLLPVLALVLAVGCGGTGRQAERAPATPEQAGTRGAPIELLVGPEFEEVARLEDALRRTEERQSREAEQLHQQKMQSTISVGATLLGAFLGGRRSSIGRATTAARGLSRTQKEASDVEQARANVDVASQRLRDLQAEFQQELDGLEQGAVRTIVPLRGSVSLPCAPAPMPMKSPKVQ